MPEFSTGNGTNSPSFEITAFKTSDGVLSKNLSLADDGTLRKVPAANGVNEAMRIRFNSMAEFARFLAELPSTKAIALGAIVDDKPDRVGVVTTAALDRMNGAASPTTITRSQRFLHYRPNQPALILLDFDTAGMPHAIRDRLDAAGGFWPALVEVIPALEGAARVSRASTSSGLSRTDTGEALPGSIGQHIFIITADGADAARFLKALQDRCWLAGLGWLWVARNGTAHVRSVIDATVSGPERLVFEGAPVLTPPLAQDASARLPLAVEGAILDTRAACPDLSPADRAQLQRLQQQDAERVAPEVAAAAERYAQDIAKRDRITVERARQIVAEQQRGVLTPDTVLQFVSSAIGRKTVAEILADPASYIGQSLYDPVNGAGDRARLFRRDKDGTICVHSFHHGGAVYELRPPERTATEGDLWIDNAAWDEADIEKRQWVAGGYLLRGAVTVMVGPPGIMKSLLALDWGVAVALGKPHGRFKPQRPEPAIIYNVEDDATEQKRRLSAILRNFEAKPADLGGRLYRTGPTGIGTLVFRDKDGVLGFTAAMTKLVELVEEIRPAVLVCDPFIELHNIEENDNTAIREIIARFRRLAVEANIAVLILHHTRKGSAGSPGDPDTARGASAIIGACRVVLTLSGMTEDDAKGFGLPTEAASRSRYVRLDDAKLNYSAVHDAEWYEKQVCILDNGKSAVAPVPWLPPISKEATASDLDALVEAIARGCPVKGGTQPWSPQLQDPDKAERSIRRLLRDHGFNGDAERLTLNSLLSDPRVTRAECYIGNNKRQGLRVGDRPSANWVNDPTKGFLE